MASIAIGSGTTLTVGGAPEGTFDELVPAGTRLFTGGNDSAAIQFAAARSAGSGISFAAPLSPIGTATFDFDTWKAGIVARLEAVEFGFAKWAGFGELVSQLWGKPEADPVVATADQRGVADLYGTSGTPVIAGDHGTDGLGLWQAWSPYAIDLTNDDDQREPDFDVDLDDEDVSVVFDPTNDDDHRNPDIDLADTPDQFTFDLWGSRSGANQQTITHFVSGSDKIAITGWQALPQLSIDDDRSANGAAALSFDSTTGILSFDYNGSGAGGVVELAVFIGGTGLTASDFILI